MTDVLIERRTSRLKSVRNNLGGVLHNLTYSPHQPVDVWQPTQFLLISNRISYRWGKFQ